MIETATKNKKEQLDNLLAILGVRMIGRDLAETPEKIRESNHGRKDGRRIKDIMQAIH